jgi:hypothetical protein
MAGMVKPVSLRLEDADVRKARPCVYLVRAASATLRSFVTGATPTNAAKAMFGYDPVTDVILRSATQPAETATPGWAQEIARVAIYDMVQSITSLSAGAEVISRRLKITMDHIAEHRVPGRVLNPAAAGQWIAEGNPAPARALSFTNAAILRPRILVSKQRAATLRPSSGRQWGRPAAWLWTPKCFRLLPVTPASLPDCWPVWRRSRPRQVVVPPLAIAISRTCSRHSPRRALTKLQRSSAP